MAKSLGQRLKIQWIFFLKEICTDTHIRDSYGRDSLKKFCWNLERNKNRIGNVFFYRKQGLFLSVYVDFIKNGWKEPEYGSHVEWKGIDENFLI